MAIRNLFGGFQQQDSLREAQKAEILKILVFSPNNDWIAMQPPPMHFTRTDLSNGMLGLAARLVFTEIVFFMKIPAA